MSSRGDCRLAGFRRPQSTRPPRPSGVRDQARLLRATSNDAAAGGKVAPCFVRLDVTNDTARPVAVGVRWHAAGHARRRSARGIIDAGQKPGEESSVEAVTPARVVATHGMHGPATPDGRAVSFCPEPRAPWCVPPHPLPRLAKLTLLAGAEAARRRRACRGVDRCPAAWGAPAKGARWRRWWRRRPARRSVIVTHRRKPVAAVALRHLTTGASEPAGPHLLLHGHDPAHVSWTQTAAAWLCLLALSSFARRRPFHGLARCGRGATSACQAAPIAGWLGSGLVSVCGGVTCASQAGSIAVVVAVRQFATPAGVGHGARGSSVRPRGRRRPRARCRAPGACPR